MVIGPWITGHDRTLAGLTKSRGAPKARVWAPDKAALKGEKMLSITRIADYALNAMTALACQYPEPVKMRDISARLRIPQPTLQKILSELVSHKLVSSIRGPDGGYFLSRPADQITFFEVVTAVEGSFRLTQCAGKPNGAARPKCEVKPVCPNRVSMRKIHVLLEQLLTGVSIAQLAENEVPEALTLKPRPKRKRRKTAKVPVHSQ